jgi:hypothetical protein
MKLNVTVLRIRIIVTYIIKLIQFTVDVNVVSKHPRFSFYSNEVSSGIRYPVSHVHAMNEYTILMSSMKMVNN